MVEPPASAWVTSELARVPVRESKGLMEEPKMEPGIDEVETVPWKKEEHKLTVNKVPIVPARPPTLEVEELENI